MGTKGLSLVQVDIPKLIELLNRALADEWLAYYQYWIGAKVAQGPMRSAVVAELEEHANDELRHAGMLVERILQLGGTPLLSPDEWQKMTNCGYDAPTDPSVKALLEENVKGEQCAIEVYRTIVEMTRGKDDVTFRMALEILQDEVEHEDDLQALQEDMKEVNC